MTFVFMVIGAFGAALAAALFGESIGVPVVLVGAVIGVLFAQTRDLRARVTGLERTLRERAVKSREPIAASASNQSGASTSSPLDAVYVPPPRAMDPKADATPTVESQEDALALSVEADRPAPQAPIAREAAATQRLQAPAAAASRPAPATRARTTMPADPIEAAASAAGNAIKRWFTQGNVPVKVGVIVLFLGVAALLKYAADQGWLRMPIQFRLAGVAVAAIAALAFAWKKRESHRSFALSLQGGAIGVLILTVFAAFRLYGLLPAGFAFALLVVIVAGGATLAVLQDAIALAVLAIAGGFLAPILTSTGSGSHVVLFTYYAVLNAAIFGIAWIRPWRVLNLIGFAFTFGIGIAWGVTRYRPELFASTEPFLVLFFAFYLLLPVLYALRQIPGRRDFVDGTLLFGTPLVAFALQVGLLDSARLPLAFSALGAAAIYALLATLELRRWKFVLLGQSHAVLALGFATLSVPLALSARSTSCTWALEGAALVWLGLRQQRRLPQWIGYGLQFAAATAFLLTFVDRVPLDSVLNGEFANALLIALAALVTARLLSRFEPRTSERDIARGFFVWGWAWLWFAFGDEIQRFAPQAQYANLALALFAATALVAGELLRRWDWDDCTWPTFAMFPLAAIVLVLTTIDEYGIADNGPLEHWAALAWVFWFACALASLRILRAREPVARIAHAIFLWLVVALLGSEAAHVLGHHLQLGLVWKAFGGLLPAAVMFALVLQRHRLVQWPLGDTAEPFRRGLLDGFAGVLGIACLLGLFAAGDPAPLAYVPLLNPLELGQIAFLLLLLKWFGQAAHEGRAVVDAELRARALATAGFALLTAVTLRSVHFLGGVPWGIELWDSSLAQATLSITWTLAGIVAMLLGQRRGSRAVWFGGAVLMGVVVAKLGLIDRRFLHDLRAIVGVLVVGLLLVAVGYFAPAPPRPSIKEADA